MTAEEIQKLDIESMTKTLQSIKESALALQEHVSKLNGNGHTSMADLKEKVVKTSQAVVERTKAVAKRTDEYVTKHPWAAAGVFAGIGVLTGMMLRRRAQ